MNIIWFKDYFKWKLSNSNPAGIGYLTLGVNGNQILSTISLTCKDFFLMEMFIMVVNLVMRFVILYFYKH